MPLPSLSERLRRYYGVGVYAGILSVFIVIFDHIAWRLLEWIWPSSTIEIAVDFPHKRYREKLGRLHERHRQQRTGAGREVPTATVPPPLAVSSSSSSAAAAATTTSSTTTRTTEALSGLVEPGVE